MLSGPRNGKFYWQILFHKCHESGEPIKYFFRWWTFLNLPTNTFWQTLTRFWKNGDGYILISDRVNHKPILLNKTNDLVLEVNQSAELYCNFYSNYFKSVDWQFQKCEKFHENCTEAPINIKVMVSFIHILIIHFKCYKFLQYFLWVFFLYI